MVRRLMNWLVALAVPAEERDALLGDLMHDYTARVRPSRSWWRAEAWYARQAVTACAYGLIERFRGSSCLDADASHALLASLTFDLRSAVRSLCRAPAFTALASITLALGIGAATAIFSVLYPTLIEPLPYPHADRLVMISDVGTAGARLQTTFGTYLELASRTRSLDAIGAADHWQPVLTGRDEGTRLEGQRVSAGYFRALGVAPAAGRLFTDEETRAGGPNIVIVSDALATRRLGGDSAAIVGRSITLNGTAYLVVGVMPRGFENVVAPAADIWAPMQFRSPAPFQSAEWGHHQQMIARLRASVSLSDVRREIDGIARAPVTAFTRPPWAAMSSGLIVDRLRDDVTENVRPVLAVIVGAVLLVLAIACVNVTNLLLARGAARRGELAVRAALGAGRWRLVRQQLVESLVLSLAGGGLGLLIGAGGVQALVALAPPGLPRQGAIHVNVAVFTFALVLTTVVSVIVGLVPALAASRSAVQGGLGDSSRRTIGGHRRTRGMLVVAEVALAMVLLVGAGLLFRSLGQLFSISPGFDASHALTMQVQVAGPRYSSDDAKRKFFDDVVDAVRRIPAVIDAGFTSQLPLSGDVESYGVRFASLATGSLADDGAALRYTVTPGYFPAMRIPLRRGRLLDDRDLPGRIAAVVISESFAARMFPRQDPIGQRFRAGPELDDTTRPWDVIVGVVGDVKQASLSLGEPDAFYVACGQWPWVDNAQRLVVRAHGDAAAIEPDVRRAIAAIDRDQPIAHVATMASVVEQSEARRLFALRTFEVFAATALALAAIGLYGVLSTSVAERTREIGVRAALGATRGDVLALVVRQGVALAALGAAIGAAGAMVASRALTTLLFGVTAADPMTYGGVAALIAGVALAACWLPAWRASRVDPLVALRTD